jgi:hypothetical protein
MRRHLPTIIVIFSLLLAACGGGGGGGGSSPTPSTGGGNTTPPPDPTAEVSISEFLASNDEGLIDEDGDSSDWIELSNTGDADANLEGWVLSQGGDTRWTFPAVTLAAGEYLVVFASGKDRKPDPVIITNGVSNLHTSFQLNRSGEYLALLDGSGVVISEFEPEYPLQRADVSYGLDSSGTRRYFGEPTPGAANGGAVYSGVVADTTFSVDRGFYTDPIEVVIASDTASATIRYTTDGATPTASSGMVYGAPITISETTVLRAAAFQGDWLETNVDTQTYIFLDDVITQSPDGEAPGEGWPVAEVNGQVIDYGMDPDVVNDARYATQMVDALTAIPTISLVTDVGNLFDADTGIYVNAIKDGKEWERPTSVELINPDESEGFQLNAGLRIRGGFSRRDFNPKHSFRLFFREEYGNGKLNFSLFGDEGTDQFDKVDLRTAQNYSWHMGGRATMLRDVFNRDTQRDMGHPYTRSRYYHLYLNGVYWGVFQTQERSEARYAEAYFGGDKEDYDVIKVDSGRTIDVEGVESNNRYNMVATDGNVDAWYRLWDVADAGFESDANYYGVQGLNTDGTPDPEKENLLDVINLIDYLLIIYYGGNLDSPVTRFGSNNVPNNVYTLINRNSPDGFKTFVHDAEHTMLIGNIHGFGDELYTDRTGPFPAGRDRDFSNPQWIHQQLVAHPEYRMKFADRAHLAFFNDGLLTSDPSTSRLMSRASEIEMAIIAESARWGDFARDTPRTKDDDWLPDVAEIVDTWLPARTPIVLDQLRDKGWYPGLAAPVFNIDGEYQHGGEISSASRLAIANPDALGDVYYTLDGSDPRAPGSYAFAESTLVTEDAEKRVLVPGNERSLYGESAEFTVTYYKSAIVFSNIKTALEQVVREPENQENVVVEKASMINFRNTGGIGHYDNDLPFPGTTIGEDVDYFVLEVQGAVYIPEPGEWTFGVNSDDGFRLLVGDNQISFNGGRGPGDTLGVFNFSEAGVYPLYLLSFDIWGGSETELFAARGRHDEWNADDFTLVGDIDDGGLEVLGTGWRGSDFDDSAWIAGTGGIGYETDDGCAGSGTCYNDLFSTDLEDAMHQEMTSAFVRIPFSVASGDLQDASQLTLRMRYEDGFVAYINGLEVARSNAPSSPIWNSSASRANGDGQAVSLQEFPIADGVGLLREGDNLLTIQGLNVSLSSSDFLNSSELVLNRLEGEAPVSESAIQYDGGVILLSETTEVSARVLWNGEWSALNKATYLVP